MPLSLPKSLSLSGLPTRPDAPWGAGPRSSIEWAARLGYRAVQLDAAVPGLRPRELDRSARRDLAALLRRLQLSFSGLDLWIPPLHFVEPASIDRAVSALVHAAELAGELVSLSPGGRAVVSVVLPEDLPDPVRSEISGACDRTGARIADHSWPPHEPLGPIGVGIDPAAVLMGGGDPASSTSRLSQAPFSARWSDLASAGRVPVGKGRLDTVAYEVALVTRGYTDFVVVDLRNVPDTTAAAQAGVDAGED